MVRLVVKEISHIVLTEYEQPCMFEFTVLISFKQIVCWSKLLIITHSSHSLSYLIFYPGHFSSPAEFSGRGELPAFWIAVWLKHDCCYVLSHSPFHCLCPWVCVRVRMCVIPFTHLEAAYSSELLCWLQSQSNQSSLFLCLSPFLTPNQNCPVFQSFLSIQLCHSIYHFIFLSFHSSFISLKVSKLFENITPTTTILARFSPFSSFLKPVYIRLICLWQKDAPLLLWASWRSALKNVWIGLR